MLKIVFATLEKIGSLSLGITREVLTLLVRVFLTFMSVSISKISTRAACLHQFLPIRAGTPVELLGAQSFSVRFPCRRETALRNECVRQFFIGQVKLLDGSQRTDAAAAYFCSV